MYVANKLDFVQSIQRGIHAGSAQSIYLNRFYAIEVSWHCGLVVKAPVSWAGDRRIESHPQQSFFYAKCLYFK